jgi:cell division septum initiation protein DivIVA
MADADLDVVIRQLAKQQNKDILAAAKKRRDRVLGLAAKAKNKDAKERYKQLAKHTLLQGTAAAKRLQIAADNAADSYARSMRNAAELPPTPPPAKKAVKKVGKKAGKKAKT